MFDAMMAEEPQLPMTGSGVAKRKLKQDQQQPGQQQPMDLGIGEDLSGYIVPARPTTLARDADREASPSSFLTRRRVGGI